MLQNQAHFYAVATKMMHRILVNQAIARHRQKRGDCAVLVSLAEAGGVTDSGADVLSLHDALQSLAEFNDPKSRIVELQRFGGLNAEATSELLEISSRTVHREWDLGRAWLFRELRG